MRRLTGAGVIPAMSNPTPPRGLLKDEEPLELPLPLEIAIVECVFGGVVGVRSEVEWMCSVCVE
jgi:hypothetical protein